MILDPHMSIFAQGEAVAILEQHPGEFVTTVPTEQVPEEGLER